MATQTILKIKRTVPLNREYFTLIRENSVYWKKEKKIKMTLYPSRFPRAVLFDWDNTLVDTAQDTLAGINAVCHAFGHKPMTHAAFLEKPASSIRDFMKSMVPESEILKAESIFFKTTMHLDAVLFPHAHTLIHWLQDLHVPTAVVSNKGGERLRKEIHSLGLSHIFYCAIGDGDTPENKPSPLPLLHALSHNKMNPCKDVWFVGDSLVDIKCAHQAGCTPVSVSQHADLSEHPKIKVGDCKGLLGLLQSLRCPL